MKLALKQKQQIIDYSRLRPEVAGVYLYGSQVTGGAGSLSDVDLAVLLRPQAETNSLDRQLEYIGAVQEIIREDLAADVKILDLEQALIFQFEVIKQGQLIVNNRPVEVREFVHRVSLLYPDFYPVLQNYYQKMHDRLEKGAYAAG
jgi:predicted nucleotidyltransferase